MKKTTERHPKNFYQDPLSLLVGDDIELLNEVSSVRKILNKKKAMTTEDRKYSDAVISELERRFTNKISTGNYV